MKTFKVVSCGICFVLLLLLCGCEKAGVTPPASITFRYSMLDNTRVMRVTNRSGDEPLVMHIKVWNKVYGEEVGYTFIVRPGCTQELGILEMSWKFFPGEEYSLWADGYTLPLTGTVP